MLFGNFPPLSPISLLSGAQHTCSFLLNVVFLATLQALCSASQGMHMCALQTSVESNTMGCNGNHVISHSGNLGWLDSEKCDTGWPPFSSMLVALAHARARVSHCSGVRSFIPQGFGDRRKAVDPWLPGLLVVLPIYISCILLFLTTPCVR